MSKRLQVVLDEAEHAAIHEAARRRRITVSEWVRRTLRRARGEEPGGVAEPRPGYAVDAGLLDLHALPEPVYRRLEERARREHRSLAGEATYLLERALSASEPLSLLEMEGLGAALWEREEAGEHVAREREGWD